MGQNEFITYNLRPEMKINPRFQIYFQQLQPDLFEGKWEKFSMATVCPLIKKWKIKTLMAFSNSHSSILKEISHIYFSELTYISVNNNFIQSIEILSSLKMPKLKKLDVENNRITQTRSFRKCNFDKLTVLDFFGNYIAEEQKLSEYHSGMLKDLFSYSRISFSNLKWTLKCETKKLNKIVTTRMIELNTDRFKDSLRRKYSQIQIKIWS